ncbi:SHOCT domain-containing protein [Nocardia thailandica]
MPDIADQLRKLAELYEAGILTEAEFSAKKQELLDRM